MTLDDHLRRLWCRWFGHDWQRWLPREDEPVAVLFREFVMCRRCGKLDR